MSRGPDATPPASGRLLSLDAFRGAAVAAMILVNNPGSWQHAYAPLLHARWHGCTFADLVFPSFLFIVGVSISYSLRAARDQQTLRAAAIPRILRRSLLLFAIGLVLNAWPRFELAELRIPGVLQRIAVVYAIAALLYLKSAWRLQLAAVVVLLVGYWLLLTQVPVPGRGVASLAPGENLAAWLDAQLLAGHMWSVTGSWDPEGILSTAPAIATALIGVRAGDWLQRAARPRQRLAVLISAGTLLVAAGLLWNVSFPLNKNLWTSSYVLHTAGLALLVLALLYAVLDVWRRGRRLVAPFEAFGRNAIGGYVLSMLVAATIVAIPAGAASLQELFYQALLPLLGDPRNASLAYAVLFVLLILAPTWWLYRRRIIIKI